MGFYCETYLWFEKVIRYNACMHTYIHTYVLTYLHSCIHAYIHTHTHTHTHTYIHTYIHTYTHTHTHTHIDTHTHTYLAQGLRNGKLKSSTKADFQIFEILSTWRLQIFSWIFHVLSRCLVKRVIERMRVRGINVTEVGEEDVSSYWLNLRKTDDTGNWKGKN